MLRYVVGLAAILSERRIDWLNPDSAAAAKLPAIDIDALGNNATILETIAGKRRRSR